MNSTFVTHPSVRIKGSENNYNPLQCFDPLCHDKNPHMHCPFCVKMDSYSDPVILKAHYRVKHVDKGIDFAGLKVLRCCDQCDIVGVIKGEKKFKGAHWHCYKCKNGFNRRDEAIKHYKTHFRNPQTTFQIQIAQEVNQSLSQGYENDDAAANIQTEEFSVQSIHPVLTEAVTCMATADDHTFPSSTGLSVFHRSLEGTVSMPGVGAIETVGDTQTIMIIQEDGNISTLQETCSTQDVTTSEANSSIIDVAESDTDQITELQSRLQTLESEKLEQDKQIEQLKKKVQEQAEHIEAYKLREQELLEQLSIPLDKSIQEICAQLEEQHRELLHQQLAQLKRSFIQTNISSQPKMITIVNAQSLNTHLNQPLTLQTLETAVNSNVSDLLSDFQNTNTNATGHNQDSAAEDTVNSAIVELDEETDTGMKSAMSTTPTEEKGEPDFVILQQDFTDSLDEDRLHIEDETIPIENDGQEPRIKRKKMK